MSVGENVKKIRETHDMTQGQLADRVGVTVSMVAQIERGTKALTVQLAREIAEKLGVSIDRLV